MVRLRSVQLVVTKRIANGAITTPKLADDAVNYDKVGPTVIQFGSGAVDSVETWVVFPTAFPGTPEVVATGIDVAQVRVTNVTPGSFSWVAPSAGSARWVAVYRA